jgi:hypothetical protein
LSETGGACPYGILNLKNRGIQKGKRELKKQKKEIKKINQAKEIRLDYLTIILLRGSISFWRAR